MRENNRVVKVSTGLPEWKAYTDFFNAVVFDGIHQAVVAALERPASLASNMRTNTTDPLNTRPTHMQARKSGSPERLRRRTAGSPLETCGRDMWADTGRPASLAPNMRVDRHRQARLGWSGV